MPLDLRDAFRGLFRDRFYSLVTILTLALTIGATTAVFSIVNGVLLRPLAYRESHRLVAIKEVWREFADQYPMVPVNEQHFEYWRAHARLFESLAQYIVLPANFTGSGEAAEISVAHTSGSLFDVLQTSASIGRTLSAEDERSSRPDVVVISDSMWRQRFGADPAIVGRATTIDGRTRAVAGVLPSTFRLPRGEQLTAAVDAYVPMRVDEDQVGWVGDHNNYGLGRLRAGVSVEQARAELDVLQKQVGDRATKEAHETVTLASSVTPLTDAIVGQARRGLVLLFAAIAAVLLVACSNLANLSLTRAIGRQREAAIRAALGASRSRLIAGALAEQTVLAAVGACLGLWVAWAALALFVRTAPIDLPRVEEVTLDGRVVAFAASVSILAGLVIAMLPALRTSRRDVQASLRPGGHGSTTDPIGMRSRAVLLAVQVALSVTLLVTTALLTVSFVRLMNVDRGFSADRVLTVEISLPPARYATEPVRRAAYDRLVEAIQGVPGVESVTTMSLLPLTGGGQVNGIVAEGDARPRAEQPTANFRFVAPAFFRTLGIPLLRGRSFSEGERDPVRPAPVVISQPTASQLWPGQDPIGRRFSRGISGEQGFEVVGVVGNTRITSLERQPPMMVYVPYWWRTRTATSLVIKAATDPASLVPAVHRAVQTVDPEIAIGRTRALDELVDGAVAGRRYQVQLFVAFGMAALTIAIIGVYAATSYGVSCRRREMNIRLALGAAPTDVMTMIVRQGFAPVAAGLGAGAIGAIAIAAIVASLLFDVRARDPFVIATVVSLVGVVGLLACVAAARQGLSFDPAAALRDE
jgi:predicted permease